MTAIRNRVISALALCCLIVVTGCSATYRNHGYVPPEEDLQNLVVGVDTRATVVSNGFLRQLLSNIGNLNPASAFE
jgi:hypothetical protein